MRAKIEEDAKKYTGTIDSQAAEIKELKLKLTSINLEMNDDNLQYDLMAAEEEQDIEDEEGEEAKYDLDGDFNAERTNSIVNLNEGSQPEL